MLLHIADFSNTDIHSGRQPTLETSDDLAPVFEGSGIRNPQNNSSNTDEHGAFTRGLGRESQALAHLFDFKTL